MRTTCACLHAAIALTVFLPTVADDCSGSVGSDESDSQYRGAQQRNGYTIVHLCEDIDSTADDELR